MGDMLKVLRYELRSVVRGRTVLGLGLFFALAATGLVQLAGSVARALPSLANLVLLAVPLVSLVFGTVAVYEGRDFTELVVSHPVGRRPFFAGTWLGRTLPLATAFVVGVSVPLALAGVPDGSVRPLLLLLAIGVLLVGVFTALAFLVAFYVRDAARGLGAALLLWLAMTVLYDGAILMAVGVFAQYPLEEPLLWAMFFNPVDLARVTVLLSLDASAMLGYTGAVFHRFFGSGLGIVAAAVSLAVWVVVPLVLAGRRFERMDL